MLQILNRPQINQEVNFCVKNFLAALVYCIQLRACILHLQPLYSAAVCALPILQSPAAGFIFLWLPVFTTFININFDVKDHDLGPPYTLEEYLSSYQDELSWRIQRCSFS